jgi:hypothetical protein
MVRIVALETFEWLEPTPIGCGIPYDPEPEIRPSRQGKKASLTNIPALLKFGQFSLP